MKRILLFIATNLLVITTISIIIHMLGLQNYLTAHGLDFQRLAVFCLIWGMTGSFISLLLSKVIAKMAMGVAIINPANATYHERTLLELVHGLARQAGLRKMPEVGIYQSPELNAFATGPSKNNALVAVSSGLLNRLDHNEVEAVLAHEITHISNGDMVTLTLIQGVVNSFALFLSRIVAYGLSQTLSRGDERESPLTSPFAYMMLTMVFDILFTLLGSILVAAFSRWREYRADFGGAKLAGRNNMIAALKRLGNTFTPEDEKAPALAAFKISSQASWLAIFSTHPPLEKRIESLEKISAI